MKFVLKSTVGEEIIEGVRMAQETGREIDHIELTLSEAEGLAREMGFCLASKADGYYLGTYWAAKLYIGEPNE